MSKEKNWFEKFSSFMDQNIRGIQYGIYSVAGLGLIIALRSVRPNQNIGQQLVSIGFAIVSPIDSTLEKDEYYLKYYRELLSAEKKVDGPREADQQNLQFAKFSVPSDIPKHFIEKKMSFIGKVNMIEPSQTVGANPLLLVHHRPLVALSNKHINDGLPLEISSVTVTGNGFMWLQTLLTNQDIKFVPLRTGKDRVYSVIYNKNQNIGQQLVSIGFAIVSPIDSTLEKDEYYLKYYRELLSAEKKAERKGAGIWADGKVSLPRLLLNKLKSVIPFSL